jgi:hypothetical protein
MLSMMCFYSLQWQDVCNEKSPLFENENLKFTLTMQAGLATFKKGSAVCTVNPTLFIPPKSSNQLPYYQS